ncbi:17139_t:CDS:2 [Dentiscutata erythropus]|uniref:17139_t:CDS:1 n=1 Tax=Dentiscutata erythropus TaxID=1348616 RepID=A0A9N9J6W6_9GLOM|nr:17139_t:CDS:2 [Dentiscutata erythropus]
MEPDNEKRIMVSEPEQIIDSGSKAETMAQMFVDTEPLANSALEIVESASGTIIPATQFLPVFREIGELASGLIKLYQDAKYNRRVCGMLIIRVQDAVSSINKLEVYARDFPDFTSFFTKENNITLRNFKYVMKKIENFIIEIQNLSNFQKIIQSNSIRQNFEEITTEFDRHMESLNFALNVGANLQLAVNRKESIALNEDMEDMKELMQTMSKSIQNIEEITKRKNAFDKQEMQDLIDEDLINKALLKPEDFTTPEEIRGKVQKWYYKPYNEIKVALKEVDTETNKKIKNLELQIGILKTINESRDIIQYFGLVTINNKKFLVTEWAEYGNLREYYQAKNPNIITRARFALEIACGLCFLEALQIHHHDVRSENVMIDVNLRAKLANFGLSRGFTKETRSIDFSMDYVRYLAPEKIDDKKNMKYDSKCEVFSFGMLLWEIAEQKVPFIDTNLTILAISQRILDDTMSLEFSSNVPNKWKKLVYEATSYKPIDRPSLNEMRRRLRNINESINTNNNNVTTQSINDTFTLEEAIKQTKNRNGSKEKAWETIISFAESNDFTAIYWKGYYLYHKLINFSYTDEERNQLAAELFKEAADGVNYMEAQYMYAVCVTKTDPEMAIEYFRKASDQGHAVSMYNLGLIYYYGKRVDKNEEEGKKWMIKAAQKKLDASITFCKKREIKID